MTTVTLDYRPIGKSSRAEITVRSGEQVVALDTINLGAEQARSDFAAAMAEKTGANRDDLEQRLMEMATDLRRPAATPSDEVDISAIVRPDLFHTAAVSGLCVPVVRRDGGAISGAWLLCLQWADGRRETHDLTLQLDTPDGVLHFNPYPSPPAPTTVSGWSASSRRAWLDGEPCPDPDEVFRVTCEGLAKYLDFGSDDSGATVAMLALWTMLTYAFPAWNAVPYLSIGGPMGSGKSRLFELLARMVYRPVASSNMTAACLFRSLHERGGVLLLDEAERLRDSTPDASDIRSVLLSGYRRGSPARRLEPAGDGRFIEREFSVYGPKACAAIGTLPEALASRCIRVMMFRAPPDSTKPRQRLDDDSRRWAEIRDSLHMFALEHGRTWLALSRRADVCPSMDGRSYELWQPLLAIAAWLDESGASGLLKIMQEYATRLLVASRDDATPEHDETLLRILADLVSTGQNASATPKTILDRARDKDPVLFARWSPRAVSAALARYGAGTTRTAGGRTYRDIAPGAIRRIESSYGLDLGVSFLEPT